ncbi:suppressor of glycerol defect [Dinochytrium kinnereticum]|nr:suppressor of glycerol defect [Dinochytrium kinnereticum]
MGPRQRSKNDTTKFPSAVQDLLNAKAQDAEADLLSKRAKKKGKMPERELLFKAKEEKEIEKRFAFRFNKKILDRKKDRKRQRDLKKQKKNEHFSAGKDKASKFAEKAQQNQPGSQQQSDKNSTDISKKRPFASASVKEDASNKKQRTEPLTKSTISKSAVPKQQGDVEERRLKRFAEAHPTFFKLMQEQNLVPGASGTKKQDDLEFEYYAKKLGYNKKKRDAMLKSIESDGLEGIFSDLTATQDEGLGVESESLGKRKGNAASKVTKADYEKELDDMFADLDGSEEDLEGDEEEGDGDFDFSDEDSEGDDDLEKAEDNDLDIGDEDEEANDDTEDFEDGEDEDENEDSDDEDVDLDSADEIDGEPVMESQKLSKATKNGKPSDNNSDSKEATQAVGKYIPPSLRKQTDAKSESYMRLKRQLQGLLNRLTDSNMESIIGGIEEAYRDNPRHDVTEIVTTSILSFISDHANLLDSFVMTYAAFISLLFTTIGVDFAAHVIQTAVERYEKAIGQKHTEEDAPEQSKKATNLASLVAHLYLFHIVSARLVFDIIKDCVSRASELDVEVILKVLRISGYQIRTDDPTALKDIVSLVQGAATSKEALQGTRAKFMIEMIMDLKNNKKKLAKKSNSSSGGPGASGAAGDLQHEKLKKFMGNFLQRRGLSSKEALGVSIEDIRSIETKGKWWLVGAAWAGHDFSDSAVGGVEASLASSNESGYLLKLAKASRMNTDIRKAVFVELMASEDYVDAFERLQRLNLKDKQEREIIRVLLHCMADENSYNPFYAWVASRFCKASHGYKITFQYALWDALREFDEGSADNEDEDESAVIRKVSHYAKFFAFLISGGFLGLTILKALDFSTIPPMSALFAQIMFTQVLLAKSTNSRDPDAPIRAIFTHLAVLEDTENLREGISFFLAQYVQLGKEGRPRMGIRVPGAAVLGEAEKETLKRRIRLVKSIFSEE